MASWFLPAEPGHSTIAAWARAVEEYWWECTQADQYFWFHRLFQRICEADPQIAGLWERVSKISADGPHRIQHLGMLSAAPETAGAVDWSTTVFKLTYRYDQAAAGSDCLLRRPVGHEYPSGASEEVESLMALQDSPSLHSSRWRTTF
jgi:Capsular polysaccharide synthesis protein